MIALAVAIVAYALVGLGVALYAAHNLGKSTFRASMAGILWPPILLIAIGIRAASFMSGEISEL